MEPQRLPAIIFLDEQTQGVKVAGLTLLDRLVVTLYRAGAASITVITGKPLPPLERATALGLRVQVAAGPPVASGPMLVAGSGVLVQAGDVRALLAHAGRLATSGGKGLPIGVLSGIDAAWREALDRQPAAVAQGAAVRVADAPSAQAAERALWASLAGSADGFVDRLFNRPCGRPLSRLLARTRISPNAVSTISIAIGLASAWCFAAGSHLMGIIAGVLFQCSAIVDCVDGDLARVLFKESRLGKWLDLAGDQVVHVAIFAAIAAGLARRGDAPWAAWLGASAVLGAVLSFGAVLQGMRRAAQGRSRRMQKLIDAVTNRDFSVLLLLLACFDRLEWFLWLCAIGSHVFWMAALGLQRGAAGKEASRR